MAKKKHPKLRRLGQKRAECAEHVCNGDDHIKVALVTPRNVPLNKNACARAWEVERDQYEELLAEEAAKHGMTVEYNGVYPTFIKDGRTIYFDQI